MVSAASVAGGPPAPLLKSARFRTLWGVGALNSTGRWLEMLVIAIFVFERTASPLLVASMLMLRLLPMALFGLFVGVLAERVERWGLLRFASVVITGQTVLLWLLASNDLLAVWHVGCAAFVSGLVWSTDFPVRRTLMGEIAGPARVSRAMSLDIVVGALTRTIGPLLGGLLYARIGLSGAFALAAVLYFVGLLWLLRQPLGQRPEWRAAETIGTMLRRGWQIVRQDRTLAGVLGVTVVFNLFGFPLTSMVPVVGADVLHLEPAGVGLLASTEGAGTLLGGVLLSLFARTEHSRYLYVGSVLCYCMIGFGFARSGVVELSAVLLFALGFVSAAFGAMQSALVLMNAPPGQQQRMMGVLSVCIGTAPLGFLHIGLLADYFGAAEACAIVALEGVVSMLAVLWYWPDLVSAQPAARDSEHGLGDDGAEPETGGIRDAE